MPAKTLATAASVGGFAVDADSMCSRQTNAADCGG